jgi:hypothetical protein
MRPFFRYRGFLALGLAWLALGPTAAFAQGDPPPTGVIILLYLLVLFVYLLPVVPTEAGVFNAILKLGYRRCLQLSLAANTASTLIGLVCGFAGMGEGWKSAWLLIGEKPDYPHIAALLLRSFLVTVTVETLVLLRLLRKAREPGRTLQAAVAANVVSYALVAAILTAIRYAQGR